MSGINFRAHLKSGEVVNKVLHLPIGGDLYDISGEPWCPFDLVERIEPYYDCGKCENRHLKSELVVHHVLPDVCRSCVRAACDHYSEDTNGN